jgi:hypothetical protein
VKLSFLVITQKQNDVEWLMLAQHYRLPTRLLDWTKNLFVALFFCVQNEADKDGAIYLSPYSTLRERKLEKCRQN